MSISNERVIDTIKAMPMFKNILAQVEEQENMKHQRQSDINERLALLENAPAENIKREIEARESREKIMKCREAYHAALNEGSAIERRHIAERFQFDTSVGALEYRLRRSAPQRFYDRLEEIEEQLSANNKGYFEASDINWETRVVTSQEFRAAQSLAFELMRERDEINKQIMEEYGYDDEGE